MDKNEVMLTGQVLNQPTLSRTKADEPMCRFQIAVSRKEPSKAKDYLDVVVWQPLAGKVGLRLRAGMRISLRGYLRRTSFQGNDGVRHSFTQVIAEEIEDAEEETAQEEIADPDLISGIPMEFAA
ncbi:MAG: single-stranded DNA-binding protein [Erysipelotrichaceae bacterium]|jgi:single-stranded DNA-binding protein|nr:single-stranded DNA-binding protein [Erysipelotrichaceae bacterium]